MAKSNATKRPGRKLIVFFVVLAALIIFMAISQMWAPRLGLDLRGGTTITLTASDAKNGGGVSRENLQTAANIIAKRVDSLGVGESSVTVQGDRQIEVSVPNMSGDQLINLVGSTARLNFRGVLAIDTAQQLQPSASPTPSPSGTASGTPSSSTPSSAGSGSVAPSAAPTPAASTAARRVAPALPTEPPPSRTPRPTTPAPTMPPLDQRMNYMPSPQDSEEFSSFQCGMDFPDVADQPLIACDQTGQQKYLLTPVLVSGENLTDAQAGIPQNQLRWVVTLSLNDAGAKDFAAISQAMYTKQAPQNQFAIVLDGKVIMAPTFNEPIPGGSAQISGDNINEQTARSLASTLRYGALPINLSVDSVDTVSPTLGGEQLKAGLIAGAIGLLLVLLWSFIYYRGLALVVIGSLLAAAVITFAVMVLLGGAVGFALNLPGIAGAIVAIGVTADAFVVYFERIRDEIREGHNLRFSIESGWSKARNTIFMADGVQLLAALVLYFLAIGAVKGFAFTLGATTAINLFLIVFFTHPIVSLLGRTRFFGEGNKWSGFDPEHLGVTKASLLGRRFSPRGRKASVSKKSTSRAAAGAAKVTTSAVPETTPSDQHGEDSDE